MKRDETETNNVNVQGNKNINENENKETKITVNDTRTHSCNISNEITMQTDQTHFGKVRRERKGKEGEGSGFTELYRTFGQSSKYF